MPNFFLTEILLHRGVRMLLDEFTKEKRRTMHRFVAISTVLLICLLSGPVFAAYYGDIDGHQDGTYADLNDAVIALRVVSNQDVTEEIRTDVDLADVDVNGDSRVGLEEAAYALQVVSGARIDMENQPAKDMSGAGVFFGSGLVGLLWLRKKFRHFLALSFRRSVNP